MMTACSDMGNTFHHSFPVQGPHAPKTKVSKVLDTGDHRDNYGHHHDSLGHPLSLLSKTNSIACPFSPTTSTPSTASSSSLSPSPSSSSLHSPREGDGGIHFSSSSSSCEGESGKTMKCQNLNGNKSKRIRTIFKAEQLEKLELEFTHQQYMVGPERQDLATSLDLTEAQVKVWFQNRRIKWRKQNEEENKRRMVTFQPSGSEPSVHLIHEQQSSLDSNTNNGNLPQSPSQHLVFNFH